MARGSIFEELPEDNFNSQQLERWNGCACVTICPATALGLKKNMVSSASIFLIFEWAFRGVHLKTFAPNSPPIWVTANPLIMGSEFTGLLERVTKTRKRTSMEKTLGPETTM
jgi:hypothetical protein